MPGRPKKDSKLTSQDEDNVQQELHQPEPGNYAMPEASPENTSLSLQVSKALRKRLEHSAREEGISVEDLASELLAEGLVLRAWEIVERKSAMRGGGNPQQQQQRQGNNRQGHHGGGNNKQGHGGGNNKHGGGGRMNKRHAAHATSLNLMEDKAAFLEYVRNQERKQR